MPATLYALLVGIDDYPSPIPKLRGCVNDIHAIEALLTRQAAEKSMNVELRLLLNEQATRDTVIKGFLEHLARAGQEDTALFYYSGHGSQERTPPELIDLEQDGLDETLVCFDSRQPGHYDLADKELASLIRHLARKHPHVVVVLDCCHSGSGTRVATGNKALVRHAPTFTDVRPCSTFFVAPYDAVPAGSPIEAQWTKPAGRHVVLSACHDDEEAKETTGSIPQRGAFSFYLTEALATSLRESTYRDIFRQVSSRVRANTSRQSPVMEAVQAEDLDRPFLGGAIHPHPPYFTMLFEKGRGWVLDGGIIHGISPMTGEETTVLALFPASETLELGAKLPKPVGSARVTATAGANSQVEAEPREGSLDPEATYKAVVIGLPLPPIGVKLLGVTDALARVRRVMDTCGPDGGPSLFVVEATEGFSLTLLADEERYRIVRAGDVQALAVDVHDVTETGAGQTVERLEHMVRWMRVLNLRNPSGRLPTGSLVMDVYRIAPDGTGIPVEGDKNTDTPRLVYTRTDDGYRPERIKVVLRNRSRRRLFCALFDLPGTFGVFNLMPGVLTLEPGQEIPAVVDGQTTFQAQIPTELIADGVMQLEDTLKVIASTEEWDPLLLEMPDLDVAEARAKKDFRITNTLSRLLRRVQTRHIRPVEANDVSADWTTAELTITIVRPRDGVSIPGQGQVVQLAGGVTLTGHPKFRAVLRLTPAESSGRNRDVFSPLSMPLLADDLETVQTYTFPGNRADTPPLSVLELSEIGDPGTVSLETPLLLRKEEPLAANESVLPYAFDGEFFLPLGFATPDQGTTEIRIVRLPDPNTRTLKGSLQIFFKKVISKHLGTTFAYPLLSLVSKSASGEPVYETDEKLVSRRVAEARTILLYIHGIIGDTQGMTRSAFVPPPDAKGPVQLAGDSYDLILAFDYENLNTPIEQTARDLKQRLAAVGLVRGHEKTLHIVAHSMGGLVARWFLEREGGNEVVSRLTMLGTPNGGSPWATYEHWFTTLLGIGLNGLSTLAWPPTILGSLMRGLSVACKAVVSQHGNIEVTLGEMKPQSDFLKRLEESADPGLPYVVIAGNTSLVQSALDGPDASKLEKLLQRLRLQDLIYRTTALAFFELPNDVAVAVHAIGNLPATRAPEPVFHELSSDHMTYFTRQCVLDFIGVPDGEPTLVDSTTSSI